MFGLNHGTAPVELRERLAFPGEDVADVLKPRSARHPVEEAVLISTCNRVELVAVSARDVDIVEPITQFFARERGVPRRDHRVALLRAPRQAGPASTSSASPRASTR